MPRVRRAGAAPSPLHAGAARGSALSPARPQRAPAPERRGVRPPAQTRDSAWRRRGRGAGRPFCTVDFCILHPALQRRLEGGRNGSGKRKKRQAGEAPPKLAGSTGRVYSGACAGRVYSGACKLRGALGVHTQVRAATPPPYNWASLGGRVWGRVWGRAGAPQTDRAQRRLGGGGPCVEPPVEIGFSGASPSLDLRQPPPTHMDRIKPLAASTNTH